MRERKEPVSVHSASRDGPGPARVEEAGLVGGWRGAGFIALLMAAMAAGTLGAPTGGVLSGYLIHDIEISRTQLGIVLGLVALIGALASPFAGRLVDRIGAQHGIAAVFLVAAFGLLVLAFSRGFASLIVFAASAGVSQSLASPATNTAIVERLAAGHRGVATGLKQSGVQAGVFLIGLLAPTAAFVFGWREAVVAIALVLATIGCATDLRRRRTASSRRPQVRAQKVVLGPERGATGEVDRRLRSQTRMLALYGALIGLSAGFVSLLPLYVADVAGEGARFGGYLIAVAGAVAVVGRTGWATLAERTGRHYLLLVVLGLVSGAGAILTMLGESSRWILWFAAATLGVSASSWNAVGMVTVMRVTHGRGDTGVVSGWVYFGFLLGVSLTGPLAGAARDHLGSYRPVLALMAFTSILSSLAATVAGRVSTSPSPAIDWVG
jgi:MFS family permease